MKTYEEIMEEALIEVPSGVDKSEGSLIHSALSKIAYVAEGAYERADYVESNLLADSQDYEHLIRSGAEAGVLIEEATSAVFLGTLNIAVEVGTRFSHVEEEFNYCAIECTNEETHEYKFEAEEPGAKLNNFLGEIEPIEFIEGFESGNLTELFEAGTDEEDLEAYRQRRLEQFGIKAFGGNYQYYKEMIEDIEGIGACKPKRRADGEENIICTIISDAFGVPLPSLIEDVQKAVDPQPGEGKGIAPICHKVLINGVGSLTVNMEIGVIFDTGYDYEDLKSYIENKIDEYLLDIAKAWESAPVLVVRIAEVMSRLITITGIIDVSSVKLNGKAENIILEADIIPKRGDISCV